MYQPEKKIIIDSNFDAFFYKECLQEEEKLIEKYGKNYDIDYVITMEEEQLHYSCHYFEDLSSLRSYYFLRREFALEEGRKIYNPSAPSRFHSIFLTDHSNIQYWINRVGNDEYRIYNLVVSGNLFQSVDSLYPSGDLTLERQVEQSKNYWKPKIKAYGKRREFIFQGEAQIIR